MAARSAFARLAPALVNARATPHLTARRALQRARGYASESEHTVICFVLLNLRGISYVLYR
jgi:hypothetical protein